MLVVSSRRFADHLTPPGHPESPERADVLEAVAARAKARGEEVAAPQTATRDEVLRVHTASHFDAIEATRGRASMIDADTFTSPDTADVALLAAGAAVQAVEAVLAPGDRPHRAAAALVRPPGHHAESGRAMGFCLYNNVAVAAAHAPIARRVAGGYRRLRRAPRQRHAGDVLCRPVRPLHLHPPVPVLSRHRRVPPRSASGRGVDSR